MMKKRFLILGLLFSVGVAHAQVYLPDGTMVDFDTAFPLVEGDTVILDGVRVNGSGLSSENDAVRLNFIFNPEALSFELDLGNIGYYLGIGVCHEWHMAIDVPTIITGLNDKGEPIETRQPSYTANIEGKTGKRGAETFVPPGEPLKAGIDYEFTTTGDTPFVANLDLPIGHVMSFFISNKAKQDIKYQLIGPNTEVKEEGEIKARSNTLLPPFKILTANNQLIIEPSNVEDSVTFNLKASNANSRAMEVLAKNEKGTQLNLKFAGGALNYAKFQVTLNPGETLDIEAGAQEESLVMKLVDKSSHLVAYVDGKKALIYKNTEAEVKDYYLFIYSKEGAGNGYRGRVFILAEGEEKPKQQKPKPTKPKQPEPADDQPPETDGSDAGPDTPAPEVPEPNDGLDAGPDTPAPEVPEPNVDENVDAPETGYDPTTP